ncbi:MAG: hypothetical protein KBB30_03635 [Bacteroidales bacterium]|jgi:hypothetical protein|nr:hypothetical protein [Bacteroidales bacterium]MDI9552910.1 hypothetical protein [Bacteroidota bacterium]
MKIFSSLRKGFELVCRARTGVLITWFLFFLLTLSLVYPLRSALNSAFGGSMITERLAEGLDIEVFADLGTTGMGILSSFTGGLIFTFLVAFLLNAFVSAGLFGIMRKDTGGFSAREFFRVAAGNFLPYLLILFVLTIAYSFFLILLLLVPLGASVSGNAESSGAIQLASALLLALLTPVFLLLADYSRAWKAGSDNVSAFEAIGYGLSTTFGKLGRSYLLMVLLILVQILLLYAVVLIMPAWRPATGGAVFLMLVVSQLLVILRLFLKAWRYASVTAMMESFQKVRPEAPEEQTAESVGAGFGQHVE